jgi:proline iminopeptidase
VDGNKGGWCWLVGDGGWRDGKDRRLIRDPTDTRDCNFHSPFGVMTFKISGHSKIETHADTFSFFPCVSISTMVVSAPNNEFESSPLLLRHKDKHLSMMQDDDEQSDEQHDHPRSVAPSCHKISESSSSSSSRWVKIIGLLLVVLLSMTGMITTIRTMIRSMPSVPVVVDGSVPIEQAQEHLLDIGQGFKIWYRTWGNHKNGIPILFVHGGPGNAVADYDNGNKRFFDDTKYYVVEMDQRGTGNSQPSVRNHKNGIDNMKYYQNISIDLICVDFEKVREHLKIDKWIVWGGSFGSTLSINYGTRYPERCLALIVRGIYLDTVPEVSAVYARSSFENHPQRLVEFDILYHYAANNVSRHEPPLNPQDAKRIMTIYANMITSGDLKAIWHWHVFENNLMETNPKFLLDPQVINPKYLPEATSVAFFETRLWLHGSYENPSNLLDRIDPALTQMPIWICQGRLDQVCPPRYARQFMDAIDDIGSIFSARFLDSGHEDTDPVMAECLKESLYDYEKEHNML